MAAKASLFIITTVVPELQLILVWTSQVHTNRQIFFPINTTVVQGPGLIESVQMQNHGSRGLTVGLQGPPWVLEPIPSLFKGQHVGFYISTGTILMLC